MLYLPSAVYQKDQGRIQKILKEGLKNFLERAQNRSIPITHDWNPWAD